jgi:hypothetical protein
MQLPEAVLADDVNIKLFDKCDCIFGCAEAMGVRFGQKLFCG